MGEVIGTKHNIYKYRISNATGMPTSISTCALFTLAALVANRRPFTLNIYTVLCCAILLSRQQPSSPKELPLRDRLQHLLLLLLLLMRR